MEIKNIKMKTKFNIALIIILISITAITFFSLRIVTSAIIKLSKENSEKLLEQIGNNVELFFNQIEEFGYSITRDENIGDWIIKRSYEEDESVQTNLDSKIEKSLKSFLKYKTGQMMLSVIPKDSKKIIQTYEGSYLRNSDIHAEKIKEIYNDRYSKRKSNPVWLDTAESYDPNIKQYSERVLTAIFKIIPETKINSYGILIVHVFEEVLFELVSKINDSEIRNIVIVGEDCNIVMNPSNLELNGTIWKNSLIQNIVDNVDKQKYKSKTIDGYHKIDILDENRDYIISYIPIKSYNWVLISFTPVNQILEVIDKVIGNVVLNSLIVFLIAFGINFLITKDIIRGINHLLAHITAITNGHLEKEFQNNRNDEIGLLGQSFIEMQHKLKRHRDNLEHLVNEKTRAIRTLLNNAGQGFLLFSKDFLIDKEYSNECVKIFGYELEDKNIIDVLFKNYKDEDEIELFKTTIENLFVNGEKKDRVLLSLLINEMEINNKNIKIEYKLITSSKKVMMILTDITEKKKLQEKIEEEYSILNMVVKSIVNYEEFMDILNDYNKFCNERINSYIENSKSLNEAIMEIYMEIHTFKGSFSQIFFKNSASNLHEFETMLNNLKEHDMKNKSKKDLKSVLEMYNINRYIEEDMKVLENKMGKNFLKEERTVSVSKDKIIEIEKDIANYFGKEKAFEVINKLKNLRYKSLKEILKFYAGYTVDLAKKLDKTINEIEILGDEIYVNYDIYRDFSKSLVHIFRNIIDHGIEAPNDRILNRKDEYGNILCDVKKINKNSIEIRIKDDGVGIDKSQIVEKLTFLGFRRGVIEKWSEKEIINSIFRNDFSTKDKVSEISGRGIGLSAVKNEVEKLGGKIEVKTEKNVGSEFIIIVPYIE